jgi:hypothetical protein
MSFQTSVSRAIPHEDVTSRPHRIRNFASHTPAYCCPQALKGSCRCPLTTITMTVLSHSAIKHKGIRLSRDINDLSHRSVNMVHVRRPDAAVFEQTSCLLARPSLQVRLQTTSSGLSSHTQADSTHLRSMYWSTPAACSGPSSFNDIWWEICTAAASRQRIRSLLAAGNRGINKNLSTYSSLSANLNA